MSRGAGEASQRFAEEEKCTVEWSRIWNIEPVPFHPKLIGFCEEAILEVAPEAPHLPSGALHDAAEVERAGIPPVRVFVQSLNEISHSKIEDSREEHLELAIRALDGLATKVIRFIQKNGSNNDD